MSCNLCGTNPTWFVYVADSTFGAWPIVRCRRCTLEALLYLQVRSVDAIRHISLTGHVRTLS